jgi:hypothetical protein
VPQPGFFGQRPAIWASGRLNLGQEYINRLSAPNGRKGSLARVGLQNRVSSQVELNGDGLPHEPVTLDNQDPKATLGREVASASGLGHRDPERRAEQGNAVDISFQGGSIKVGHVRGLGGALGQTRRLETVNGSRAIRLDGLLRRAAYRRTLGRLA